MGYFPYRVIQKGYSFLDRRLVVEESPEAASSRRLLSQPDWFSALGALLSQVASRHFPDLFAETVGRLVPFDYTVSFAYRGPGKPICLAQTV